MAVRDLLWGCPICRTPGGIRPTGRREHCGACGSEFRRGAGASIVVTHNRGRVQRSANEWVALLGPVESPLPGRDGVILGPEAVRVKLTRHQKPLRLGGQLLGWVEIYEPARTGVMILRTDGLRFAPRRGSPVHWGPGDLTGLQPASSALQLGLHRHMASVKFLEGSVRLWTRALSDLIRSYHREHGRDVTEMHPCIRTASLPVGTP